ncbi:hypothetical protein BC567DRAFT_253374 [Phyllosticta citribraziliensis]
MCGLEKRRGSETSRKRRRRRRSQEEEDDEDEQERCGTCGRARCGGTTAGTPSVFARAFALEVRLAQRRTRVQLQVLVGSEAQVVDGGLSFGIGCGVCDEYSLQHYGCINNGNWPDPCARCQSKGLYASLCSPSNNTLLSTLRKLKAEGNLLLELFNPNPTRTAKYRAWLDGWLCDKMSYMAADHVGFALRYCPSMSQSVHAVCRKNSFSLPYSIFSPSSPISANRRRSKDVVSVFHLWLTSCPPEGLRASLLAEPCDMVAFYNSRQDKPLTLRRSHESGPPAADQRPTRNGDVALGRNLYAFAHRATQPRRQLQQLADELGSVRRLQQQHRQNNNHTPEGTRAVADNNDSDLLCCGCVVIIGIPPRLGLHRLQISAAPRGPRPVKKGTRLLAVLLLCVCGDHAWVRASFGLPPRAPGGADFEESLLAVFHGTRWRCRPEVCPVNSGKMSGHSLDFFLDNNHLLAICLPAVCYWRKRGTDGTQRAWRRTAQRTSPEARPTSTVGRFGPLAVAVEPRVQLHQVARRTFATDMGARGTLG